MSFTIIVRGSKPRGQTRTLDDRTLQDSGWGSSFKSEEDADKCAFAERKLKEHFGADNSMVPAALINRIR